MDALLVLGDSIISFLLLGLGLSSRLLGFDRLSLLGGGLLSLD